jgi:hypothetical protein
MKHFLDCTVYNNRDVKLVGKPTLEDTTHRNSRKTKAWLIWASDSKDPENILQPFGFKNVRLQVGRDD